MMNPDGPANGWPRTNAEGVDMNRTYRVSGADVTDQTFLIQLANGKCGYLPTYTAENNGGYGALVMNGKVGSDGGTRLVDETVKMINSLF